MKKIIFILPMIAVLMITACSHNKQKTVDSRGVTDWRGLPNFYLQGHDSIIACPDGFHKETKPYTKCDGTRATYQCYVPDNAAEFPQGYQLTLQGKQISPDSLLTLLGVPPGSQIVLPATNEKVPDTVNTDGATDTANTDSNSSGISLGWLWSLLKILFAIAVVALALFGLWKLLTLLAQNLKSNNNNNPPNGNNGNQQQPVQRVEVINFPASPTAPAVQSAAPAVVVPTSTVNESVKPVDTQPTAQNVTSVIVNPQGKLFTRKITVEENYFQPTADKKD